MDADKNGKEQASKEINRRHTQTNADEDVFTAETQDVRKNSKTIKIAKSASTKTNTYNCSFRRKGIFSHDRRVR